MGIDTSNGHPDMNYKQHVGTYTGFIRWSIFLVAAVLALLAAMAFFLT